jgi:hypothetical protein
VIIAILITTAVVARRNLRAGEGDRAGARKFAILVGVSGLVSSALRAHHVPLVGEEARWALSVGGWNLMWASFSWMAYISFEPYVRRLWPGTLVSWTRVLSGRVRDPLIGRDVLVGLLAAVCLATLSIVGLHAAGSQAPEVLVGPALLSLRSPRSVMAVISSVVLEGTVTSLGLLFTLAMIRLAVRKTWIVVVVIVVVGAPMTPGVSAVADLPYAAVFGLIVLLTTVRFGLVASIVMQICERLLTRFPLTLHLDSWYLGLSLMILLLVAAVGVYGFIVSLEWRPAFGAHIAQSVG